MLSILNALLQDNKLQKIKKHLNKNLSKKFITSSKVLYFSFILFLLKQMKIYESSTSLLNEIDILYFWLRFWKVMHVCQTCRNQDRIPDLIIRVRTCLTLLLLLYIVILGRYSRPHLHFSASYSFFCPKPNMALVSQPVLRSVANSNLKGLVPTFTDTDRHTSFFDALTATADSLQH